MPAAAFGSQTSSLALLALGPPTRTPSPTFTRRSSALGIRVHDELMALVGRPRKRSEGRTIDRLLAWPMTVPSLSLVPRPSPQRAEQR